ncbi:MAG: ribonuclease E/G, partial [Henriciella sp.]
MSKLRLIDAVHPEETRVALVSDGRVDDFDFETTGKEQLRGNIYLAKVTRVEPSLQACFVEYGGNRHGFLAFSEIHPDYYQLPQEDREALLQDAARAASEAADDDLDADDPDDDPEGGKSLMEAAAGDDEDDEDADDSGDEKPARRKKPSSSLKRYKIQEVIRRRQVMLVQVVKEERGNKGAALTTFLSLAGRYSVLMPNTPRGGGISRKISNGADRKRLKDIMSSLDVPHGMGLIVRTAGAKRTKTDIRRDYEYLQKLWDNIRSKTLESIAPCMIHEEGGLVHRAMRDMFDKDIEEVVIQGQPAYREAKDLSKM